MSTRDDNIRPNVPPARQDATPGNGWNTRCSGWIVGIHEKSSASSNNLRWRCRWCGQWFNAPDREQPCTTRGHYWDASADAEGDTCNCGAWYRFAGRIERTPDPEGAE